MSSHTQFTLRPRKGFVINGGTNGTKAAVTSDAPKSWQRTASNDQSALIIQCLSNGKRFLIYPKTKIVTGLPED